MEIEVLRGAKQLLASDDPPLEVLEALAHQPFRDQPLSAHSRWLNALRGGG